jgi:hypothetical protein
MSKYQALPPEPPTHIDSSRGCDVHVAVDGNFHHRHSVTAGDSPHFYDPQYILPKDFVDEVGSRIKKLRKTRPKAYKPKVPDEAVDTCEKTHEAANELKQKTNMDHFDDTGVMALVCRHDIPLFLANIDTPGEGQKYAVALLEHLFTFLPACASVAVLYDVGCVLDRSLNLVCIGPSMCLLTNNSFPVRHLSGLHHRSTAIRNKCNACVRASMGLSTCVQPTTP